MITDDERKVIDEMIKDRHEFAVFTNLSRRLQTKPSSLAETSPRGEADRFERRGLDWVMALARVEVGAMLAGFSRVSNPFEVMRPTRQEMPAYAELLLDGTRTHYWSLAQDKNFRKVASSSLHAPGADTMAYVRRMKVAREFQAAAAKIVWQKYSSVQQAEMNRWQKDLKDSHQSLADNIQAFLSREKVTQRKVLSSDSTFQDNSLVGAYCGRQLAGERYAVSIEYRDTLD